MFSGVGDAGTTHITGSIPPGEFGGEFGEPQPGICQDTGGIILATGGFKREKRLVSPSPHGWFRAAASTTGWVSLREGVSQRMDGSRPLGVWSLLYVVGADSDE